VQRLILLFILLNSTINCLGQSIGDELLRLEMEYFNETNDSLRNNVLFHKMDRFLLESSPEEGLRREGRRINKSLLSHKQKEVLFWNLSLANYLSGETYQALHYLKMFEEFSSEKDSAFLFLAYLSYLEYDTVIAESYLDKLQEIDQEFICLNCISEIDDFELKNKNLRLWLSCVLPGFGTASAGKPVKGVLSLGINVLSAVSVVYLIQNQLWLNNVLWGSNLAGKFYLGNIRLAEKTFKEKEGREKKKLAEICELHLYRLMLKYPLEYRSFSR
jgi:hypothetical protein